MKLTNDVRLLACGILALSVIGLASAETTPPADTIVVNARIYTVNKVQPWAQALAVRQGKIVAVGTDQQIKSLQGPKTKVIDATTRMVLPGLVDAHMHMALEPFMPRLFSMEAFTIAEVKKAVGERAKAVPNETALLGYVTLIKDAQRITKKELDEVVPDIPVLLMDGHNAWLNSKALAAAGITSTSPDPQGGSIAHDPASGEPTGLLGDAAAVLAFKKVAGEPGDKVRREAYLGLIHQFSKLGVTRLFSAGHDEENIDVFDQLRRDGLLTAKMTFAQVAQPPQLRPEDIEVFERRRAKYHDAWISAGAVKFFNDGLVESGLGAMVEPYLDAQYGRGNTLWAPAELKAAVTEVSRRGFIVAIHATGDRALRDGLDAYEQARQANGPSQTVMRIEHCEHVTDQDLPRFGQLGVIASMQPTYAADIAWNAAEKRIGHGLMRSAYPWFALYEAGARVAFGSDTPGYSISPWDSMGMALTATKEPEQRLTVAQAIEASTLNAARAAGVEQTEGSIEVGKAADLIIISQDLFAVAPQDVAKTQVLTTMVEGKVVWSQELTGYSVESTDIGTLLDDPAAKAVLDKYVAGLSTNPQIGAARSLTLKAVQHYVPEVVTDKALVEAQAALSKLPRRGAPGAAAYSIDKSEIGSLLDDPAAKAVLDKYMPGLSTHPQIDQARAITLRAVQQYAPEIVTAKALQETQEALAKLGEKK